MSSGDVIGRISWLREEELMKQSVSLALVLLAVACAGTPEHSPQAALSGLVAVEAPQYDTDRDAQRAASREEYEAARSDIRFVLTQFTYQSDGETVGAYLYRPIQYARRRAPVVVFNRGSFTRPNGFASEFLVLANRYADAGFIVVAPHYRGSNGWHGRDEMGGADLNDLMNLAPEVAKIEGADSSRIFLAGESRGGMMVYQALREGFSARAAAVWGGFTDLAPLIAPDGPQARFAPMIWPDIDQNRDSIIQRRSAMRWADRIKTPILIMHGEADSQIPLEQSRQMARTLTELGRVHELRVFEGEQHTIAGRGAERDAAAIAWFRRFGG